MSSTLSGPSLLKLYWVTLHVWRWALNLSINRLVHFFVEDNHQQAEDDRHAANE